MVEKTDHDRAREVRAEERKRMREILATKLERYEQFKPFVAILRHHADHDLTKFLDSAVQAGIEFAAEKSPEASAPQPMAGESETWCGTHQCYFVKRNFSHLGDVMVCPKCSDEIGRLAPRGRTMTAEWKMVPVEPTEEMLKAFRLWDAVGEPAYGTDDYAIETWREMLAASPSPPSGSDVGKRLLERADLDEAHSGLYTQADEDLDREAAALIARLEADRDDWKEQHENLLAVKQADNAALSERIEAMQKALKEIQEFAVAYSNDEREKVLKNGLFLVKDIARKALSPKSQTNGETEQESETK